MRSGRADRRADRMAFNSERLAIQNRTGVKICAVAPARGDGPRNKTVLACILVAALLLSAPGQAQAAPGYRAGVYQRLGGERNRSVRAVHAIPGPERNKRALEAELLAQATGAEHLPKGCSGYLIDGHPTPDKDLVVLTNPFDKDKSTACVDGIISQHEFVGRYITPTEARKSQNKAHADELMGDDAWGRREEGGCPAKIPTKPNQRGYTLIDISDPAPPIHMRSEAMMRAGIAKAIGASPLPKGCEAYTAEIPGGVTVVVLTKHDDKSDAGGCAAAAVAQHEQVAAQYTTAGQRADAQAKHAQKLIEHGRKAAAAAESKRNQTRGHY